MTNYETEKIIELMKNNVLFSCVGSDELKKVLAENSELISYGKDKEIFSRDNYRHAIGMVVKGQAQVKKGKLFLSTHKSGDIFGAVTLFSDSNYYATQIVALTACKVVFISKDGISALMQNDVCFSRSYISYLSQRIYFLNSRIDSLTAGNIEDKLMQYIKDNAVDKDGKLCFAVRSYGTLAANLDSGRASLYRAMDSLTEKGVISRDGKTIYLKKE